MKLFRRKSSHRKAKHKKKLMIEGDSLKSIREMNFEKYIGGTVTIYVEAGGMAGKGFSGVLLGQTTTCLRLLILPNMPPSCTLGNKCKGNNNNTLLCLFCPFNKNVTIGTIAEISLASIVAFVHNSIVQVNL